MVATTGPTPATRETDNVHFSILESGVGVVFCRMTPTQAAPILAALQVIPQSQNLMTPCLKVMTLPDGMAYHWDVSAAIKTAIALIKSML